MKKRLHARVIGGFRKLLKILWGYIDLERVSCLGNRGIKNIKDIVGIYWCRRGYMPR